MLNTVHVSHSVYVHQTTLYSQMIQRYVYRTLFRNAQIKSDTERSFDEIFGISKLYFTSLAGLEL